jgi:hypothetical protein
MVKKKMMGTAGPGFWKCNCIPWLRGCEQLWKESEKQTKLFSARKLCLCFLLGLKSFLRYS